MADPERGNVRQSVGWMLLIVVAAASGLYALGRARAASAPANGASAPQPTPVTTTTAEQRDIPIYFDGLGVVQAYNTVTIRTQLDGQVVGINFKEGDQVHKNDVLAKIDSQPLQAQIEQAQARKKQDEAKLYQDQAHVKQDQAKVKQDQAKINQDKAKITQDQADLSNAKLTLTRLQSTMVANAVTQQSVDDQKTKVALLEGAIQADDAAVEADVAAVQSDEAAVQADVAGTEADQATIQADASSIKYYETQLAYATIRSPIDGVAGIRQVDVGNIVRSADASAIVLITQIQPISMVFTLPQQDFRPIHERMSKEKLQVLAMDPEGKGTLDQGVLELIDNQIDPSTGSIKLKATFPNQEGKLWPGGFVNARLLVETRKGAIVLPAPAIQQGPEGEYVYVIKSGDTAEFRKIKLERVQDGTAVVATGLEAGEQVVLQGQDRLRNGSKVQVSQRGKDAPKVEPDAANPEASQGEKNSEKPKRSGE